MRLYLVKVEPGGKPLKFRQVGGGVFSNLDHAKSRLTGLLRYGSHAKLYQSQEIEWEEMKWPIG